MPASAAPASTTPATRSVAAAVPVVRAGETCAHGDGGAGHPAHADRTCAAAGVASAYAPPALAGAAGGAPAVERAPTAAPASAVRGRAPPDLSELQLLRI
ncbi:DUF6153 family protein [Streptomyces sp. MAR4 CNX-425]|uniref:DUF6153 family protein n=1 Tax=Streptomyces sp. MAR4 CNX-425 TaxID=3406343 RepID=UPI003B4FFD5A